MKYGECSYVQSNDENNNSINVHQSKPTRLARYPESSSMTEPPNATVSNGCIDQRYGRPLSLLLDAIRFLAAKEFIGADDIHTIEDIERMHYHSSSQQSNQHHARATTRLNYFLAIAWSHWTDPGAFHSYTDCGVMELAKQCVQVEWTENLARQVVPVDSAAAREFEQHKTMVHFCANAFDHIRAVKSWHIRIHGDFWVVSGDDQGTYLIPQKNEDMVYQCVGLSTSLHETIQKKYGRRPMVWKVTLIPFYGRLVYDGVVTMVSGGGASGSAGGKGGLAMVASESKRHKLLATVHEARQNRRVIQRLMQLEVEGGSLEGLPTQGLSAVEKRLISSQRQLPPTETELRLLKAYIRIRSISSMDDPKGLWVFRRKGYTEQENPDHAGLILGRGEAMGFFQCSSGLQPTSTDILEAAFEAATSVGFRPYSLLSDDYACYQRLKFLFRNVKDTTIDYYHPPTPEETAAAVSSAEERPF